MSQNFVFPNFGQMYPYEKRKLKRLRENLRYRARTLILSAQCRQFVEFLTQNPLWQPLFKQKPYRVNALLNIFCDRGFNGQQRLQAIEQNLLQAEQRWGVDFCQHLLNEQRILLAKLTDELSLYLNINEIDPYEGFFALSILDQNDKMIYAGSFTFLTPNQLLIASIQGPNSDDAQDVVRAATKTLHGVRPMFMLLNGFKVLADLLGCELLGIVHKRQAKYRWNSSSKLMFNYDEFWQENEGQLSGQYWRIPTTIERRPLEEIQSKKRSMYRKRYEMFDAMIENMQLIFKGKTMNAKYPVITVDGPSGAGKGTLCYALAQKLGFRLLDSGAIYRVTGLAALRQGVDFDDENALAEVASNLQLEFVPQDGEVRVMLNGEDVSAQIRTQEVADAASRSAVYPAVRKALLKLQQDFASEQGLIADGRDMGTVVFPDAQVKLFLDASAEERAKRRFNQLQNKGINGNFEQILAEIKERDLRDRNRPVAPLKPAEDALLLDSTSLTIEQVIDQALSHIQQKLSF